MEDKYLFSEVRPTKQKETLFSIHEYTDYSQNPNVRIFQDNAPQWNPKSNTYVYDFKGRVTQPSIKNF